MILWTYHIAQTTSARQIIPEVAGKDLSGRIYIDSKEYRPKQGEFPIDKEYNFVKETGEFDFPFEIEAGVKIDIPYYE